MCESLGGYLVCFNTKKEWSYIKQMTGGKMKTWVALTDEKTEGVFEWVDGSSERGFRPWNRKEPNNKGGNENYALMREGGWMIDISDDLPWSNGYICEWPREVTRATVLGHEE